MITVVTYSVVKELYYNPDVKHNATLITTEYTYKSNMLVHLQIGRNLGISINNLVSYSFKKDINFENEQFMSKKLYNSSQPKKITQSTFEEKLKGFDMSQTKVEQEILEEYSYTDNGGHSDNVQIVIKVKDEEMVATIDFKSMEQHQNFVCPAWLVRYNPTV